MVTIKLVKALQANILLTVPRRYFFCGSLMFFSVLCLLCLCTRVCSYVPCGLLLGKGWPLGSRLWCTVSLLFPIGVLGQVWYLIESIPDLCTLTYFQQYKSSYKKESGNLPSLLKSHNKTDIDFNFC